jgi:predicted pyridoxine 5'-phosphate oxidase superfamily flavin-nucleotide-binding protein
VQQSERPVLDADVRAVVESAHLVFAATVTPDGQPNLSPKGTIRVWDNQHLFFLDIASPKTRANLEHNPKIELNVVEHLSRRGYRFSGTATLHRDGNVFREALRRVFAEENAAYPVNCVVLVEVERMDALVSPGYMHVDSERAMREAWRRRRAALDATFDEHANAHPFVPRVTEPAAPDAD